MKGASIKDVAIRSGASVSTVSIVINGKGKQRKISEKTIQRVWDAAKELDYIPNSLARSLRTGRTNTIGLIVDDISNFFFSHLAKAIELEVEKSGYTLMFCNSKNDEGKVVDVLTQLIDKQMDGYIIAPTNNMRKDISLLTQNKTPFVFIDRYFPDLDSNYVIIDNYKGAFDATKHLIDRGYQKVGIVIRETDQIQIKERFHGYESALGELKPGHAPLEFRIPPHYSDSQIRKGLSKFLKDNPDMDSILFTSNSLGILGLDCFKSLGIKIGEDVGMVCFDDNDTFRLLTPSITVVAQPIKSIGKIAAESILFKIGEKSKNKRDDKVVLRPKLVVRESTPQKNN